MQTLEKLFRKKEKLVIGLMSGTSADGIDAALVRITGSGPSTAVRQLAFRIYPYPAGLREILFRSSDARTARLDEIARLDMLLGSLFADAARKIARRAGVPLSRVDLIGSHGQTIHHLPSGLRMFGKTIRATVQVAHPSAVAKLTGVLTVGDFRVGDVAAGGSGAPLVPLFDFLMFRSPSRNRALLNIGGIANITILSAKCAPEDVRAFDTGPGNMVVDGLMNTLFARPFDTGGQTALRGKILPRLLRHMESHPYLQRKPPKSTGREDFGESFLRQILRHARGRSKEDIVTTASEFTALSIYRSYLEFIRKRIRIDEMFVSGGGVHNAYLMGALSRYFGEIPVRPAVYAGVSPDAKEAICFAVLANETIAGHPGNLPSVTGARKATSLGVICLP